MNAPMVGTWIVLVHEVKPFSIHGDQYFELHVTRMEDPTRVFAVRVPQHAAGVIPQPGQRLELTFLMGQVTGARVV